MSSARNRIQQRGPEQLVVPGWAEPEIRRDRLLLRTGVQPRAGLERQHPWTGYPIHLKGPQPLLLKAPASLGIVTLKAAAPLMKLLSIVSPLLSVVSQ